MYTFNRDLSQFRRPLPQPIPPAGYGYVLTPATNTRVGVNPVWKSDPSTMPPVSAMSGMRGLGDGLSFDGQGLFGTGLFEGGFDISNWTIWEWGTIALGAVALMKFTKGFGKSKAAKRKELKLMRDEYALTRDE